MHGKQLSWAQMQAIVSLKRYIFPFLIWFESNSEFMQALKDTNLKVEAQRLEIRQLQMENAALWREIPKAGKGWPQKNPPTVTKNDERIALHGHKFGVMNELFVDEAAFLVEESGFDLMDNTRYTSPALIMQGVITELFEEVPGDLHGLMKEHTHFQDLVSHPCWCSSRFSLNAPTVPI